jgi:putative RecB family exonuclease
MRKKPAGTERKARKPVLSPTKISAYLTCPLLYKLIYVDKLGRYVYRPKSYHSFGSSLHRAISDFHTAGGAESETAENLVARLRERWVALGYASSEEEGKHLKAAAAMLEDYYSAHEDQEETTLLIERQLRCDMGDFILMGRIDRLVELPDGTINVIDYKSGRECVTQDDVRNDLAMSIYQLLASKNYPGKAISATIYCLRTNVKATVSLSSTELLELEDELRGIAADLLRIDSDSVIEPVHKEVCTFCDFLPRCKRLARQNEEHWD